MFPLRSSRVRPCPSRPSHITNQVPYKIIYKNKGLRQAEFFSFDLWSKRVGPAPKMVLKLPQNSIFTRMMRRKYCKSLGFKIICHPESFQNDILVTFLRPDIRVLHFRSKLLIHFGVHEPNLIQKRTQQLFRRILNGLKHLFVAIHTVYITF